MKRLAAVLFLAAAAHSAAAAEPAELPKNHLDKFIARNIGPANMGGRITDLAVVPGKATTIYVATASGGLWKTSNNGITWAPLFDDQTTGAIGAVAVSASNPDVVWAGTGEANARNSVSCGDGVYKSADGGKTWQNMGLKDSHHVGRIVIHPKDPDTVYVAALGHLWGPNKERGVFKTTDGGKTWAPSKVIDENTGAIDLAMDPSDPDTIYAAFFRVRRDAFCGPNPVVMYGDDAGLYKTSDGGKTWKKMTKGLPKRPLGRCAIDVYRKDPKVLYAVVASDKTDVSNVPGQPAKTNNNPENGGIFRSDDRGETWVKLNDLCPRPFYFSLIRVDPNDDQRVYVGGVPLFVSKDGGKTFNNNGAPGVHADHHALWIDPADSGHLILGNDGGVYFSYDRGAAWEHIRNMPLGQFYGIVLDNRKPYRVIGGLQDNGNWGGPTRSPRREGITAADWFKVTGADGFQCQLDPKNDDIVYCEAQYGRLARVSVKTGQEVNIQPKPPQGGAAYRFNWNSPIVMSAHQPGTMYFGGNHVFRSGNRGDSWDVVSPDLTRGQPGPSKDNGHTLTALAESPLKEGLLWAGSDDGRVSVTRNGGKTWAEVGKNIPDVPAERTVTRIECSPFAEGTAYVTLDRHRNDDRAPYVFKTEDCGATWKPLTKGLPAEGPAHVLRADRRNRDLLFLGTECGLFVTINGGETWQPLKAGLPPVPVHDLAVHPRDHELVIGTHGRSIYVLDVTPLQELNAKVLAAPLHLYDGAPAVQYAAGGASGIGEGKNYLAPNPPPGAAIWYSLAAPAERPAVVTITDPAGKKVVELTGAKEAGLHRVQWDLRAPPTTTMRAGPPVAPGVYTATIRVGDQTLTRPVRVEAEE
jgi:photosystem II stability/assembly factor-like uncharacterized protein